MKLESLTKIGMAVGGAGVLISFGIEHLGLTKGAMRDVIFGAYTLFGFVGGLSFIEYLGIKNQRDYDLNE